MNTVRKPAAQRTEERRAAQREALVEAAEKLIAMGGLGALKARDLASEIGVALGALYNLVPDLDALNMRVASRTLARMESYVIAASQRMPPEDAAKPVARLTHFAHAYRRFASENKQLWRALFEYRNPELADVPEWLVEALPLADPEAVERDREVVYPDERHGGPLCCRPVSSGRWEHCNPWGGNWESPGFLHSCLKRNSPCRKSRTRL